MAYKHLAMIHNATRHIIKEDERRARASRLSLRKKETMMDVVEAGARTIVMDGVKGTFVA